MTPQLAELVGFFMGGPQARSAGFNSIDVGAMNETTWLVTECLMFIGGGSAGTGGGIKLTTFMLLFFAIVAEVRAEPAVSAFGREVSGAVIRREQERAQRQTSSPVDGPAVPAAEPSAAALLVPGRSAETPSEPRR